MKRTISTSDAPAAVDAYSQATTNGEPLLTTGQLPLTPDDELLDDASAGDQTEQCLGSVTMILAARNASLDDALKTTIFLNDIDDFEESNEVYGEFFDGDPSARSAVEVGDMPKGAAIGIEAIAIAE